MRTRFTRSPKWLLLGFFLIACSGCRLIRSPQASDTLPASIQSELSPYRTFDNRPYELIWSERGELRKPAVSFSNVKDWRVENPVGLSCAFGRSKEQQLWGEYTGQFSLKPLVGLAPGASVEVLAVPPQSVAIVDSFDTVSLWVWLPGDLAALSQEQAFDLSLLIGKQSNRSERISFELKGVAGWNFLHKKLEAINELPLSLDNISLTFPKGIGREPQALYMDSLNFYREPWDRLVLPKDSQHAKGSSASIFDFHPPVPADSAVVEVIDEGGKRLSFASTYNGDELVYKLTSAGEQSSVLDAYWNGFPLGDLLQGLGCSKDTAPPHIISTTKVKRGVSLTFSSGLTALLNLKHRTLSIELNTQHRDIEAFNLGQYQFSQSAKALSIPFYRFGSEESMTVYRVQRAAETKPVFVHVYFDPAYSGASEYIHASGKGDEVGGHGQLKYLENTEGIRPALKERIYITVSSTIQDVLPAIAKQAEKADDTTLRPMIWRGAFAKRKSNKVAARCTQLRNLGMGNLFLAGGPSCWSDGHDSFAYRTEAAPYQGGDAGLATFVRQYQDLGMSVLLYTHIGDLSPLNGLWNEHLIARNSDGSFKRGCCNSFVLKNAAARCLSTHQFSILNDKFSPSGFVMDMQCISFPGKTTDFDSRTADPGSFAPAYQKNFGLLASLAEKDQTIIGLDGSEWLYAGAVQGVKSEHFAYTLHDLYPLNPIFSLCRVAPQTRLFGMGPFQSFFEGHALAQSPVTDQLDRYLCTQVAYGLAGELVDLPDTAATARSYFMMLELQAWRGSSKPQHIAVHDGERYRPFSERCGLSDQEAAKLYIQYENGLEIWVNGSFDSNWTVHSGPDKLILPPAGWLAKNKGDIIFSGARGGTRFDYMENEKMIYMDARGAVQNFRGVSTQQALILYKPDRRGEVLGWGMGAQAEVTLSKGHKFVSEGGTLSLPSQMPEKAISSGWPLH